MVKLPVILAAPLPVPPPVILPVTLGALHAYVVPAGTMPFVPFTGVTLNNVPVTTVVLISVIVATGLIFTATVNDAPAQLPDTGLTWYVAVTKLLVVFTNVPLILPALVPDNPPVKPVPVGADQLYVVPAGTVPLDGVVLNIDPEHTVVLIAVTLACGLMVTVTLNTAPVTPFDNGVTR